MAGNANKDEAHSEATKWFVIAVIGTILYVSAVFAFVINGDLGDEDQAPKNGQLEVKEHGQPH
jgi:hypothetical protein